MISEKDHASKVYEAVVYMGRHTPTTEPTTITFRWSDGDNSSFTFKNRDQADFFLRGLTESSMTPDYLAPDYLSKEARRLMEEIRAPMLVDPWREYDEPIPKTRTPKARAIDPSETEQKAKRKTKAERLAEAKQQRRKLEDMHTRRLLELESARTQLKRYSQVSQLLVMVIVTSSALTAVSLVGLLLGFDNAWLSLATGVLTLIASVSWKIRWYETHRLRVETKDNKLGTMEYLDPLLDVRLAEAKYSQALGDLTEFEQ